jgi:RsbT co-antagonist protein rsbRD N-terminal domain
MNLSEALQEKKKQILSIWIDRTLDSYISSDFFKHSRDQIANPIGANIRAGLTTVFELLIQGAKAEEYVSALDQVIRIRAIQDFTPSQAVVPFLELKWVVRQVLADDKKTSLLAQDLSALDCEIDRVALAAFDIYTACREQLYQVRIKELKSGSSILTDTPCSSKLLRERKKGPVKIN